MQRILLRNAVLLIFSFLMTFFSVAQKKTAPAAAHATLDAAWELRQLYDISLLPAYRKNTVVAQVSSYDTTGGNDDGFSGRYSFLRRNPDSSLVIFDQEGAGVIQRIWTPTPNEDTLDFYLDDNSTPAFSMRFIDLFSGSIFPFVEPLCGLQLGGYYNYYPIQFQKSCRIVTRGKRIQFHQIQYRMYPKGTLVKKFSKYLSQEEKEALARIKTNWSKQEELIEHIKAPADKIRREKKSLSINPGSSSVLFNLQQGGRILGLEFTIDEANRQLLTQADIRITWDEDKTPAVYCPLSDFFGYAFGKPSMQSFLLGNRGSLHYCYFPMPFDKKAKIEIINRARSGQPLRFMVTGSYSVNARNAMNEGRFYGKWNSSIHEAGTGPHEFLHTKGKGHYVGSVLQASGLHPGITTFFEGDDSTAVDGQPRIHGTGSEDYFNGGWYAVPGRWDGRMSLPLHGALDYSIPNYRTGAYRFYLGDKISFNSEIYQSIEHGPENNNIAAAYTSMAYYYADRSPANIEKPTNALTKVALPDTLIIYPQLLKVTGWGDFKIHSMWVGEDFLIEPNNETMLSMDLGDIAPGDYRLFINYTEAPGSCQFSLWQRQTRISGWFNADASSSRKISNLPVSEIKVDENHRSLSFQFKTGAAKAVYRFNSFVLIRKT